ncbi:hypothetical protein FKM82_017127 [Ascaphus truei]
MHRIATNISLLFMLVALSQHLLTFLLQDLGNMSAAMQKFPLIPKQLLQGKVWVQKRLSSIHSKPPKGKVGPALRRD